MKQNPEEAMYSCVRCGACRDACPTLDITGKESDGPRGRVFMARSLIEGNLAADQEILHQLDRCLLCSACVDACPLDVPVPDIVMAAKEKTKQTQPGLVPGGWVSAFFLKKILPVAHRLQRVGHLLWFYQRSGLQKAVHKMGLLKLFPEPIRQLEAAMPEILPPRSRKPLAGFASSKPNGMKNEGKHVALFRGCIMDMMFRQTNDNTIRLLTESGNHVRTPSDQVCCGALHVHNGDRETAKELAKQNIQAFEQAKADVIISNAGGCGAWLREYEDLFRDEPEWLERSKRFSGKVQDISEWLAKEGGLPEAVGAGERITYQPSCHLQYVMKVKDAPKQLLKKVKNSEYVELPESKLCCGSAGIYNILQPELANDILDKKMGHVESTQSSVVITANPGCLLQMKMGIQRARLQVEAKHIVDYLVESIERTDQERKAEEEQKTKVVS